jgi:hypothetical protein
VFDQGGQSMRVPVVWASSDSGVATVDRNGTVGAVGEGRVIITARSGNARATTALTVRGAVRRVAITPAGPHDLAIGEDRQLGAAAYGNGDRPLAGRAVRWRSSNDEVATVTPAEGRVTARGSGEATIFAASGGVEGSVTVRVPEPAAPPPPTPSAPPPRDARLDVADLVTRYAAALQSREISRILAIYPTMQSEQARELRESLQLMDGLQVRLTAESVVLLDPSRARARVTGQFSYRGRGRQETLPIDNTYNFERRDGVWIIVSIL